MVVGVAERPVRAAKHRTGAVMAASPQGPSASPGNATVMAVLPANGTGVAQSIVQFRAWGVRMRPALSSILLAPASGAGLGLLTWFGFSIALLSLRGAVPPALQGVQLAGLGVGVGLTLLGLLHAVGAGRDRVAWRTLTHWRNSWLAREVALAALAAWSAAMLVGLLLWIPAGETRAALLACLALLLATLTLSALACAAMVYASQKSVLAWRHPLVVPVHMLFGLMTGLALMYVLMSSMLGGQGPAMMAITLGVLGGLLLALKWLYWYEVSRTQHDDAAAPAVGDEGGASLQGRGYVSAARTFALARDNRLGFRLAITAAVLGVPVFALLMLAAGGMAPLTALLLCVVGTLVGAVLERWLFVAEARHVVTVYR